MKIRLLSKTLINKISAGEVLERPASAVKELVENSIDARAKNIKLQIRRGGKAEITVIDDGHGIINSDLKISVQKHSTSKLLDNNLNKISTLGFRGEALSSIGAVSKMKIISRTEDLDCGYEICVDSGNVSEIRPVNRKVGTTIIVKDIFFSTPARLNFLRSEKYENFLIKKIVQKLALSNVTINFELIIDDKIIFKTTCGKEENFEMLLRKRIIDFFGENFFSNLLLLNDKIQNLNLRGFIGLPTFHNSNKSNQFIFVNKRVISDNTINQGIRFAYRDFMAYDRHPQLILFLNLPYGDIDINVHPNKNEVRFKDKNFLRKSLIYSVKKRLAKAGHLSTNINSEKTLKTLSSNIQSQINFEKETDKRNERKDFSQIKNSSYTSEDHKNEFSLNPLGFAKGQFHENYIISQSQNGIILIDQHAAHERIVYEKMKKDFYSKSISSQILLIPEVIKVDPILITVVEEKQDYLKEFGFVLDKFGKDSIIVREIPSILAGCNIKELTTDIINEITDLDSIKILEEKINKICSTMACHGSIRSGREMKVEEMNNLLRSMENTPYSGQCNHGRPTYIELKIEDIEKLFGRK